MSAPTASRDVHPHWINAMGRNIEQASRCLAPRQPAGPTGAAWGFVAGVILALAIVMGVMP